ncbi:unnamed protein product [Camellia sinensis]
MPLILKGQDLSGVLPRSIVKLPHLKIIDLSRNYLSGPLPREWASTKLELMSLSINRISGTIPKFFGRITSLTYVSFESNMFDGTVPAELGNLVHLCCVWLRNLKRDLEREMEKLPKEFSNLINLRELRLSSNNFNGKLPSFQSCKQLGILELEASGFEGPIPSGISLLHNLTEMQVFLMGSLSRRITDLNGGASEFPHLENMKASTKLTLRNCNISGPISVYLANLSLTLLDLSFNRLEGHSPDFEGATYLQTMGLLSGVGELAIRAAEVGLEIQWLEVFPAIVPVKGDCSLIDLSEINDCFKYLPCPKHESQGGPTTLQAAGNWGFSSTGHFWDVNANAAYYQTKNDELVLKDFDIETVAQGVDKAVVLKFNNTVVKNKTMEIRFYWAGKGTRAVPDRGIYGPLISAISIESNSKPHSDQRKKIVIVIGAVTFSLCLVFTILFIFWRRGHSESIASREQELRGLDLQTGLFTFRQIKAATNNFDNNNKIGEGGFGSVYKGVLLDGTVIAVKQLSSKSKQGNREFVNEIGMISGLQHPNLLTSYGPQEWQLNLGWPTRLKICIGIARGLAFLHEESRLKIVHRDIKATNVLLDGDLNPKISDFGLAKLSEDDNTHISTRVAGTIGYMAPEYALWGYLTNKTDVYSFGIVALEIAAGKDNMKFRPSDKYVCLLDWALVLQQKGRLMELVDPKLGPDFDKEEAIKMIKIALLCTNPSPAIRPAMSAVVSMLEGHLDIQDLVMDPSIYGDEFRFRSLKDKYDELQLQSSNEAQTLTDSMVTTEIGSSSTSTNDLYQINCHSV